MKKNIKDIISIGDTVDIPILIDDQRVVLKSSIEGVGEDNKLIISAPLYKLNYYPIRTGDVFRLHIKLKTGIVELKSRVLKRVKIRSISTIVFEVISEPLFIQRREFFRLKILKDLTISYGDGSSIKLMTKEISAGGLSGLVVDFGELLVGQKVVVTIDIGSQKINLLGEVLYCAPFKDSIRRFEYRIKFIDVSEKTRRLLLNYIFSEQRKLMKKK